MFESLSSRFEGVLKRIRGKGRLGPEDVEEFLGELRLALLEADVHLSVVHTFQDRIRERAVGVEVSGALNPGQQVVKIVLEELTEVLGGETHRLTYASKPPTVVLLAGLQGSGKTTTAAKLARWFKAQGRNPMLIGADLQRPAAVEQLRTLAARIDVPVFSEATDPVSVARAGLADARSLGRDVVICDTAGRLAIDDDLMAEVAEVAAVAEVIQMVETAVDTVVKLEARITNQLRNQARATMVAKIHNQVANIAARKAATIAVAAKTATEFTLLLEFEFLLD